jgi:hypothetical protein
MSKNVNIKIYRGIILPVVLCGRETLSLNLKVEHRMRLFENRMLRKIFRSKREEMIGGWRKLCNVELHNLHTSPNIKLRRIRLAGHIKRMGKKGSIQFFGERTRKKERKI